MLIQSREKFLHVYRLLQLNIYLGVNVVWRLQQLWVE